MTRKERMLLLAETLSKAECGSRALDVEIARLLGRPTKSYTTDWNDAFSLVGERYDWIVASVNGQVGGTPYATVGQHTRYAETPILSLCAAVLTAYGSDPRFVYAIGYKDDCGAYGMVFGPTPDLKDCLDFVPEEDERVCYVLRFEGEVNQVIARWNKRSQRWFERVTMTAAEARIEV